MDRPEATRTEPEPPAKTTKTLLAFLAFVLFAPPIYGQAISEPTPELPAITANVNEVTLDLVVRKKNKPVLDLRPGDIAVIDSGSPVKLSALRLVTADPGSDRRVTLVFDQLDPSAAKNAHRIASKILESLPASGFSFCVLNLNGRLRLLQEFTADRAALAKTIGLATEAEMADMASSAALAEKKLIAVAQSGTDLSGVTVSARERAVARMTLAELEESQRIVQDQHAQPSLSGLLALARTERRIAGRKVIVYFAQGLQADSNTHDVLQSIVAAANQAGVSIYTVDANALRQTNQALLATMAMGNAVAARAQNPVPALTGPPAFGVNAAPGASAQASDQSSRFENSGQAGNLDPLAQLAANTDGAYITPGDDVRKPVKRMIEEMTTYYEASFVPSIQNYDGQFRPVVVKPTRKGLKIRSRGGYYALSQDSGFGVRPFEAPLVKILDGTQLPTDVRFRSAVLRLGDLPDGNANALVIEVPLAELEMRKDANTNLFLAHVSIVAQIKNKAGTVIEHFGDDIPRRGALEALEAAKSEVVTLQRHFVTRPGEYVLEAVVVDRNSGKAGAQRIDFAVPNAAAGSSLSDVTLVRRSDPFSGGADPLEPLRYQNSRVVPNLSGQVPPDARTISLFFLVHADPNASEPATLEMEVVKNSESVGRMPLPFRKSSGVGAVPYLASIQANSLGPGNYEATAILTQGDKTSESAVSFSLAGPELASVDTTAAGARVPNSTSADAELVSDSKPPTPGIDSREARRLVITQLSPNAVSPPTPDEFQAIVEDARKRALAYSSSLPNFMCVEVTNRSVDPVSNGRWRHKDSIAELLRYRDNQETRTTLEINGQRSDTKREDLKGTLSHGEFGGVLSAAFQPSSQAEFHWKEAVAMGGETVQVLSYRVAKKNSSFGLTGDINQVSAGFHGLVYVDSATKGIRRITVVADDLPHDFSIHTASITVDYDYIAIGAHDHLMPVRAIVSTTQGKRTSVLNEIAFRNYRRYGSQARISYGDQVAR